jgi:hypothetical protein
MAGELTDSRGDGDQVTPPEIDTSVAHVARVYNYWLGGTENYPAARLSTLMAQRVTPRSHAQVTRFFDGLEVLEPGVVPIQEWRPASDEEASARGHVGRRRPQPGDLLLTSPRTRKKLLTGLSRAWRGAVRLAGVTR